MLNVGVIDGIGLYDQVLGWLAPTESQLVNQDQSIVTGVGRFVLAKGPVLDGCFFVRCGM